MLGLGIVVFATTNIDDILLLSAFFAARSLPTRAIVVGQFVGLGVLTAASAIAALLALVIPEGWTGLLGLAPLALGLHGLYSLWSNGIAADSDEALDAGSRRTLHSQWITVASVTVANGGDNLGVYIPLFAREPSWIPIFALIFAVMTAVWCIAGHWLVNHPFLGSRVRQYGQAALPFVLIGLGFFILWDARVLLAR